MAQGHGEATITGTIIDLHNHAELSLHTTVSLADYLREARRHQVAVAITEHNRLYPRGGVIDGVLVLPGMEILNDYGDFLVFGAPEDCVDYRDIIELADYVHRCGGAIIAAHPYHRYGVCRVLDEALAYQVVARMDAVEVYNGRAAPAAWDQAEQLALAHGKPGTGGSDAHQPDELFTVGTRFVDRIGDVADLVQALRAGRCSPVRIRSAPHRRVAR